VSSGCWRNDATEKEVDVVGFTATKRAGEFVASKGSDLGDVEGVAITS